MLRLSKKLAILASTALGLVMLPSMPAIAQTSSGLTVDRVNVAPGTQMLVDANEIVYDYDRKVVVARGNVKIYYGGYIVEANEIIYDEANSRLKAPGRVKLTEPSGTIYYADQFDFSDDFRNGFVRSLLVETTDKATFVAASGERVNEDLIIFNKASYTACKVCADKPVFWNVKSKRIIYDQQQEIIQFESPSFEFMGRTILRLPSFSAPGPNTKRKTGILAPSLNYDDFTGASIRVPYFMALAPNYDITFAPQVFSNQGLLADVEWRHRLANGQYIFRVAGIHQLDPDEAANNGNQQDQRGAFYTQGRFELSDRFALGWSGWFQSDDTFLSAYDIEGTSELHRTAYLNGFSERNSFELAVHSFQRQQGGFDQDTLPLVHPSFDYKYIFEQNPLGGELKTGISAYSLSRNDFADASRLTGTLDWRNQYVSRQGLLFEPFAGLRADYYTANGGNYPGGSAGLNSTTYTQRDEADIMPYAGATLRYPLVSSNSWGVHVVEPIAQVVSRPNVDNVDVVNEDAQSLIFDASNLFELDKYSGYDRKEGGSRANVGARYTLNMNNGGSLTAMVGQSFHLAGDNPFPQDSGLYDDRSDFVGSAFFIPSQNFNAFARVRLDKDDLSPRAVETQVSGRYKAFSGNLQYAHYDQQAGLGINSSRQQVAGAMNLNVHENWRVFGGLRYDIEDQLTLSRNIGIGYRNECFVFDLGYTESFDSDGDRSGGFNFRLELRTLLETEGGLSGANLDQ